MSPRLFQADRYADPLTHSPKDMAGGIRFVRFDRFSPDILY